MLRSPDFPQVEQALAPLLQGEPRVIGGGVGSVVLDIGGNRVARIGRGTPAPVPNIPEVLQPLAQQQVGGWRVEIFPQVDTTGITDADVVQVQQQLGARGYQFSDAGTDNLGRLPDGRVVVLDPGAVTQQGAPAATYDAANALLVRAEGWLGEYDYNMQFLRPATEAVDREALPGMRHTAQELWAQADAMFRGLPPAQGREQQNVQDRLGRAMKGLEEANLALRRLEDSVNPQAPALPQEPDAPPQTTSWKYGVKSRGDQNWAYKPMVLVSDKPSNDISILQTKFSD